MNDAAYDSLERHFDTAFTAPDGIKKLCEEFFDRDDFRNWLLAAGLPLPRFWYAPQEPLLGAT